MKLIFQAFLRCLPLIFIFTTGIVFFFTWISIMMVKVYKDDGYYCDNAYAAVGTKQGCFEWGGDWVKEKVNMSSILEVTFFFMAFCTMEDLTSQMARVMDLNGKGNAP